MTTKSGESSLFLQRTVWILDHYAVPPSMSGFTRQYEHASILSRSGWEPFVFATPYSHKRHKMERPVSLIRPVLAANESGVPFIWLYTVPYEINNWRRYLNMISFLMMTVAAGWFRKPPDIVLASSPHLFTGLAGWVLAKRHHVPFVLEVRDLWPDSLVQLGMSNRAVSQVLKRIEGFLYAHADTLVSLTQGIESGIRAKGYGAKEIVLVPNAALRPEPLDGGKREEDRRRYHWSDKTVAIWIGAHGPANGLEVLVEAARLTQDCPSVLFAFVGEGPSKLRLIDAAGSLSNVQFMDAVPKSEVGRLLRAADIGVIVHRDTEAVKGARPNKLFDYMAAGLPIVLNLDGEARSLLETAGAGNYVPAENAGALAAAIKGLAESPQVRHDLGQRGFHHVAQAHSREDCASILARVLDRLVQKIDANDR